MNMIKYTSFQNTFAMAELRAIILSVPVIAGMLNAHAYSLAHTWGKTRISSVFLVSDENTLHHRVVQTSENHHTIIDTKKHSVFNRIKHNSRSRGVARVVGFPECAARVSINKSKYSCLE